MDLSLKSLPLIIGGNQYVSEARISLMKKQALSKKIVTFFKNMLVCQITYFKLNTLQRTLQNTTTDSTKKGYLGLMLRGKHKSDLKISDLWFSFNKMVRHVH